jgi:uncharacterized membrane protein
MKLITLSHIRKEARDALKNKWGFVAEFTLIFLVVSAVIQGALQYLFFIPFIILPVIKYGYSFSMLKIARKEHVDHETLFVGFSEGLSRRIWTIFFAYLIVMVRIILWGLLFIIPGIIAAYSYSQTFYILADKDVNAFEAIDESKKIKDNIV